MKFFSKKKIKKKCLFIYLFFLALFQFHQGYSIAVVDDGYIATLPGLKCLKGNEIDLDACQSHQDPHIAVMDDGYVAASVGL
jgi:hypothetical protein